MKNRGITLVSLAITVIILLILAAISLNFAIGKHGIITKAKEAKENMLLAQIEEENSLNEIYKQMGIQQDETSESTGNEEPSNMKQILEQIEDLKKQMNQQQDEIKQLKEKSIDDIYPVGSIYMTTDITTAKGMAEKFGGKSITILSDILLCILESCFLISPISSSKSVNLSSPTALITAAILSAFNSA